MSEVNCVAATLVPEAEHLDFAPTFFGRRGLRRLPASSAVAAPTRSAVLPQPCDRLA